MKKLIKSFSCFALALVFGIALAACGNKDKDTEKHDPQKETPTVSVVYEEKIYFAGDSISSVDLSLYDGSTEGAVAWENSSQKLEVGLNTYKYIFTPKNTTKYSSMTKTVQVYAIGNIYKSANDDFGYRDYKGNYIEFEREGNTLKYTSTFDAGSGVVVYDDQEIVLQKTAGQKVYTITIGDYIQIFDYDSGTLSSSVGNLNKYYSPEFFGTYTSNTVSDASKISTLTLTFDSGVYNYTFDYYYSGGHNTEQGTFTVSNETTFIFQSPNGAWKATYNKTNNSLTIGQEFFLLSGKIFIKG